MNETETKTSRGLDRGDVFLLVGIGLMVAGVGMIYKPAAVIFAGFLCLLCAALVTYGRRMEAHKKLVSDIKAAKSRVPTARVLD